MLARIDILDYCSWGWAKDGFLKAMESIQHVGTGHARSIPRESSASQLFYLDMTHSEFEHTWQGPDSVKAAIVLRTELHETYSWSMAEGDHT